VLTGGGGADDRLASAEVVVVDAEKHGIRFATQPLLTVQLRPQTLALFELDVPIVVDDRALPEGAARPVVARGRRAAWSACRPAATCGRAPSACRSRWTRRSSPTG
jgi:hypothetical protein